MLQFSSLFRSASQNPIRENISIDFWNIFQKVFETIQNPIDTRALTQYVCV